MKKYILILFVLLSTTVFSQSKKEILVQKWKLIKVEEFGQKYPPTENQKNDMSSKTRQIWISVLISRYKINL